MTVLMIDAGRVERDALVTRTGGVPLAPVGTSWPRCTACEGPMCFIAQILLEDLGDGDGGRHSGVLAVFMCQNEPGMCDDWNPTSGGNKALLLPSAGLNELAFPKDAEDFGEEALLLGAVHGVSYETIRDTDYGDARARWAERTGLPPQQVLGRLGGSPSWIQNDETPSCPSCTAPMSFVAQLEEGPEFDTDINFGGCGIGYAFACRSCARAAFVWQR